VLLEVAALWQETTPLTAVLRGEPVTPDVAACPPEWKPALRKVLTRGRVESWLARWEGRDLTPVRIWLCLTLELPALVRYLAGAAEEAGEGAGEEIAAALPWATALWRPEPLEERLRLIARLAQEEWLAGQDRQATAFVAALLRLVEPALRELCSHALSGRGPLPWLAGIAPNLLELLVPVLAPVPLVNALFTGPAFDGAEPLLDAVARRVQEAGARCPPDGYREEQLKRHAALAGRLAPLVSWESCSLDPEVRRPNGPDDPASCATEEI